MTINALLGRFIVGKTERIVKALETGVILYSRVGNVLIGISSITLTTVIEPN